VEEPVIDHVMHTQLELSARVPELATAVKERSGGTAAPVAAFASGFILYGCELMGLDARVPGPMLAAYLRALAGAIESGSDSLPALTDFGLPGGAP
jgi:hypothetical protein